MRGQLGTIGSTETYPTIPAPHPLFCPDPCRMLLCRLPAIRGLFRMPPSNDRPSLKVVRAPHGINDG